MKTRRKAREAALQLMYQCDTLMDWSVSNAELYFSRFQQEVALANPNQVKPALLGNFDFCRKLVAVYFLNSDSVDSLVSDASDRWSIRRMARVDRNILRLATIELFGCPDIPTKVSLNEAIELAKQFGTPESPLFINGVLDNLASSVGSRTIAWDDIPIDFWPQPEPAVEDSSQPRSEESAPIPKVANA